MVTVIDTNTDNHVTQVLYANPLPSLVHKYMCKTFDQYANLFLVHLNNFRYKREACMLSPKFPAKRVEAID